MTFNQAFTAFHIFGKKYIIDKWGKEFYSQYFKIAKTKIYSLENELPDDLAKEFDFFYKFIVVYVAIYYALEQLDIEKPQIEYAIWIMNEYGLEKLPKQFLSGLYDKKKNIKKLIKYQEMGKKGLLKDYDWKLEVHEDADGSYHRIYNECGAYKLLKSKGYGYVFPCACRVDYLIANLGKIEFKRDRVIADGDSFCDSHVIGCGYTEWAPEKGFINRKLRNLTPASTL